MFSCGSMAYHLYRRKRQKMRDMKPGDKSILLGNASGNRSPVLNTFVVILKTTHVWLYRGNISLRQGSSPCARH